MRLPGGAVLRVDNAALADAIAAEWQAAGGAKGGEMTPEDVPLTQLAGTAQERIAPDPAPAADAIAKYAETDLLCYRAEQPAPLVARQAQEWQPWLDWLERDARRQAAARPRASRHVAQDAGRRWPRMRDRLRGADRRRCWRRSASPSRRSAASCSAWRWPRARSARRAPTKSPTLDEMFQMERWGEDEWAAKRRARRGRRRRAGRIAS